MLVNSIPFWIFFPAVAIPYFWLLRKSSKAQNIWLLIASYFFYGYAEIKMIPVILIATIIFYFLGIQIEKENKRNARKASLLTTIGVVLGVGLLVYFKYLNFLIKEFATLFESMGLQTNMGTFKILMPLGISYFTFKLISYVIEIHREKMDASHDPVAFATFVAFFPAIMAGPIDRPNEFLPQLDNPRKIDYSNFREAITDILWGMFLKMCIADRFSSLIGAVYGNYNHHSSTAIILASIAYLFQAYTDFCGYSNMAIGVSKLLGIKIIDNFNRPLLACNMAELWRRWHISLTSWITDYIFKPLTIKFRNLGNNGIYLATIINMVVVGAWHGANWTYVIFGLYHGIVMILVAMTTKRRKNFEKRHSLKKQWYYCWPRRIFTWVLFIIGVMVFRSESITDYFAMCSCLFNNSNSTLWQIFYTPFVNGIPAILIMLFKEYKDENNWNIHFLHSENRIIRLSSFAILIIAILLFGELNGGEFIYFKF